MGKDAANENSNKVIVAYARVSTQRQAIEGFSLQQQERFLKEAAKQLNYKKAIVFKEVASGKFSDPEKRPELWRALDKANRLKSPILVTAFDRLSRNTGILEKLIRDKEITVISFTEGEISPLIVSNKIQKAKIERELISKHTREALQAKKQQGIELGNRTNLASAQKLGHLSSKRQADNFARSMISRIDELRAKGSGFKKIATTFNHKGIPTRRGGKWHATTVKKVMDRAQELKKLDAERLKQEGYGSW